MHKDKILSQNITAKVSVKIWVQTNTLYTLPIIYTLEELANSKGWVFIFVESALEADVVIKNVATLFYQKLHKGIFKHIYHFEKEAFILNEFGAIDYLSSAFYVMNCFQEYDTTIPTDKFGRFRYIDSFQYKFGGITENLVQQYFDAFIQHNDFLKKLPQYETPTKIYLTHDIDSLYGSLLHESLAELKSGNIFSMFRNIFKNIFEGSQWFTIAKILSLHQKYDFQSIFLWLTQQARDSETGIKNADYDIHDPKVQAAMQAVKAAGSVNGLHKSTILQPFQIEIGDIVEPSPFNRYHFFKFRLPQMWQLLEREQTIKMDFSLGFAEHYGFRNGYARAFRPFDWKNQKRHSFWVVPTAIMDGTLGFYMKLKPKTFGKVCTNFLKKHQKNASFSLLWHNNEFSEGQFLPYLRAYEQILKLIKENNFQTSTTLPE